MLVAGKMLYSVDLASGKTAAGKAISGLSGEVTDIAINAGDVRMGVPEAGDIRPLN